MIRVFRHGFARTRHVAGAVRALTLAFTFALPALAASPKRVLFIESFSPQFQPEDFVQTRVRRAAARFEEPLEFFEVSIEQGLVDQPDGPLLEYIRSLFHGGAPDLIVTVSAPAMRFAGRRRAELFPDTPLLFAGADAGTVADVPLGPRDATVLFGVDVGAVVASVRAVVPRLEEFVLVVGSSAHERATAARLRSILPRAFPDIRFRFTDGLAFDDVSRTVAALGSRAIVYYLSFRVDAGGRMFERDRALDALHDVAKVPLFTLYEYRMGRGVLGGYVLSDNALADRAADAALALLRGASPPSLRLPPIGVERPIYDVRELDRFHVDRAKLPPDSEFRFASDPPWWPYRWHVGGGLVVVVIESQLIVSLVMNRRRLKAARATTVALNRRLMHAQEEERTHLARELHDDFAQRLSRLAVDAGRLEGVVGERGGELARGILALARDLSRDVSVLAYRLHPVSLQEVGLVNALRAECEAFDEREGVRVHFAAGPLPEAIDPDLAKAFFRVAQESLRNVSRHAKASSVHVTLYQSDHGLELAIRDDGRGFDPTVRAGRPTLGIASMRERMETLGGSLALHAARGGGVEVVARAPFTKERPS